MSSSLELLHEKEAERILKSRLPLTSSIRLLPKETGVRVICNLSRRTALNNKHALGSSVNSRLKNGHAILRFERFNNSNRLGSSLFSADEIYPKLKDFKSRIGDVPLFFVKADILKCFDNIDQNILVRVVSDILSQDEYLLKKIAIMHFGQVIPRKEFRTEAFSVDEYKPFHSYASQLAKTTRNKIFIDNVQFYFKDKSDILRLIESHILDHIIKVNKSFFRQRNGIAQGSSLSSFLCNFFYGDFERKRLKFTSAPDSLLMRLTDDFLFITSDRFKAEEFLQSMIDGHPDYGIEINKAKTLVNFNATLNEVKINKLSGTRFFPYCGLFINTKTLEVIKDVNGLAVYDGLSVELNTRPGLVLMSKTLNVLHIHLRPIFTDTNYNTFETVVRNLYEILRICALRLKAYISQLQPGHRPSEKFISLLFDNIAKFTFAVIRAHKRIWGGYSCKIRYTFVRLIVRAAFEEVFFSKRFYEIKLFR